MSDEVLASPRANSAARWLTEFVVVCLGVLLALFAESWWEQRSEEDRVASYLQAVHADLLVAESQLATSIAGTDQARENLDAGLELLNSTQPVPDSVTAPGVVPGGVPVVPIGNLDALVRSGDVNLIEDAALRTVLVNEHAGLVQFLAYLAQLFDRGFSYAADVVQTTTVLRVEHQLPRGPLPLAVARRSPELVGQYEVHSMWLANRRVTMVAARASVERILASVSEALE